MKTAVSIPDEIFQKAERFAKRRRCSRSRIFSDALREYLTRHSGDEVTEAVNRACREIGQAQDSFSAAAAYRALVRTEW
ncbi:MAG TPA: hypothetical protein VL240_06770 [Candidatus Binatia bacterium]|nr:hypothetical protein [Candidatus Binatia bacterium]